MEKSSERQWILYENKTERLAFCNFYMACVTARREDFESDNLSLLTTLTTEIEYLKGQNFQIVLVGDTNAWTGEAGRHGIEGNRREKNVNGEMMTNFLEMHDLDIANKLELAKGKFTRYPFNVGLQPSILDMVCMNSTLLQQVVEFIVDEENLNEIPSDHRLIQVTMDLMMDFTPAQYIGWKPDFKIKPGTYESYAEKLDLELMNYEMFEEQSCEAMYAELIRSMQKVGLTMGKTKMNGLNKKLKNKSLKRLKNAYQRKNTEMPHSEQTLRAKNDWISEMKKCKSAMRDKLKQNEDARKKIRLRQEPTLANFWAFAKTSTGAEKMISVVKRADGVVVFSKKEVKEAFREEFKTRWEAGSKPLEQLPCSQTYQGKLGEELDVMVTLDELKQTLQELKNEKAIGLDGISNELLKCMTSNGQKYLLAFVNKCFEQRKMPNELKSGRVKLLFKGGDARLPVNYRPITVNSVYAKVMTKIITKRMTYLVERENILQHSQFGFRKNMSTGEAVVVMNTMITQSKLLKHNLFLAFVDLEKGMRYEIY